MISKLARLSALASVLAMTAPATAQQDLSNPQSNFEKPAEKNWSGEVRRTERGYLIGNPDAEVRLIEFVSYTCSVCALFAKEGDPAIDFALLAPGKMSMELRPYIRNELDVTLSLLVGCGNNREFKALHRDFLWSQDEWLKKVSSAPASQQAAWLRGDTAGRLNAAQALDLDDKLIARGFSPTEITNCLSDVKAAEALLVNTGADRVIYGVTGTPSFALDNKLLKDVYSWATLYPVLEERFKTTPAANGGFSDSQ